MNQSPGITKVRKSTGSTRSVSGGSWDMLYYIKRKYPGLMSNKSKLHEKNIINYEQMVLDTLS